MKLEDAVANATVWVRCYSHVDKGVIVRTLKGKFTGIDYVEVCIYNRIICVMLSQLSLRDDSKKGADMPDVLPPV